MVKKCFLSLRPTLETLLLASEINPKSEAKILELGCASGLLCLLLAKLYPKVFLTGLELQTNFVEIAKKNVQLNNLENQMQIFELDICNIDKQEKKPSEYLKERSLQPEMFDVVIANPPYYKTRNGRKPVSEIRTLAYHEFKGNLSHWFKAASHFLKNQGIFYLSYTSRRMPEVFLKLKDFALEPKVLKPVYDSIHSEGKIFLLKAIKNAKVGLSLKAPIFCSYENQYYFTLMKKIETISLHPDTCY